MTGTEQDEFTEDMYQDMNKIEDPEDSEETAKIDLKITESHNTQIAVFNDFKKTISHVENEVSASVMLVHP